MKKTIILLTTVALLTLCGCKSEPKMFNSIDYSMFDTKDFHVTFTMGADSCYSDGSYNSNQLYKKWVKKYEEMH